LTLKFLGEIDDEKIRKIKEKLKGISFPYFETEIDEMGIFSEKFIKIIWLKLGGDEIFELQKKIDEVLSGLFESEERFMSHITIARVKKCDRKKLLDFVENFKIEKTRFAVDKFYLKESKLFPEGPKYSIIEEFDLIKRKYK